MRRLVLLTVVVLSLLSCEQDENKLNGFYYDIATPDIYYFADSQVVVFNLLDSMSLNNRQQTYENKTLQIDGNNYAFEKMDSTLVIIDYPGVNQQVNLKKFGLRSFDLDIVNCRYWVMEVEKQFQNEESNYLEEQYFKIDFAEGLDAYYKRETDTIYGAHYDYVGLVFKKFNLFKRGLSTIIVYAVNNQQIDVLLYNGYGTTFSHKFQEFTPINGSMDFDN